MTDTLPPSLRVASPANASTTCPDGTVTATPGTNSVRLTGGEIPASGSCTVTVTVTPVDATTPRDSNTTNTIPANALTTAQGVSNAAAISASVRVQTGAQVIKAFSPSTIPRGGRPLLTLTLRNLNSTPLTNFTFSDLLPAAVTAMDVEDNTCGGTAEASGNTVTLSGPETRIPAAPSGVGVSFCTITVRVTSDTEGRHTNQVPAGQLNGVNYSTVSTNLTVTPAGIVSLNKQFVATQTSLTPVITIPQTGVVFLAIRLNNSDTVPAAIQSFVDNLPTPGITIAPSPAATNNCGGTLEAMPGTTVISLTGGRSRRRRRPRHRGTVRSSCR